MIHITVMIHITTVMIHITQRWAIGTNPGIAYLVQKLASVLLVSLAKFHSRLRIRARMERGRRGCILIVLGDRTTLRLFVGRRVARTGCLVLIDGYWLIRRCLRTIRMRERVFDVANGLHHCPAP
jgi:hypothetical protein